VSGADGVEVAQRLVIEHHAFGGQVFPQMGGRAGSGDEQHVGGQLQQPLECDLRRGDAKAGGCLNDHRAGEHGVVPAARPAKRAERHERDTPAEALLENRGPTAEGEVEQVLHADNVGPGHGVPELVQADVAQAYPGDEALVAGRDHRRQLVIEPRVDPPATGQAQVHRSELPDPQAAQVVLDALAQLVRIAGRRDGAAVVWPDRDLADDGQPVGVGVERFADQVVDDAGAVVLGARLPARTVAAAVFASTGLARLLPAGPAAAAAWQAGQYRRRDAASGTAGLWAVLAGGIASAVAAMVVLAAGAIAAARWWPLAGSAATLVAVTAAAMAARRVGGAARWLGRHAGRSRRRWRLAAGLAGLAGHRPGLRRGAAALAASGLSVLAEAGLLAAAFEVAGTPVPWRGLLLACAAGQLGARLVPLPGGLGGMEGGVLGALALTGTHPATALAAVIVYRVVGYWAPGAAGAVTAAVLTRRQPAPAARTVTPLRPQAPPPPASERPPSACVAASAAPGAQPIVPAAGLRS
jgi:uncharacterized membrane protein YbhN (UPF0104 family)